MESLIVRGKEDIQKSLTTYISKIITKDPKERIEVASIIKEMYNIRSEVVHQGKRSDLTMSKLSNLQIYLRRLILKLIELSNSHETKESILQEIDEAINEAY